MRVVHHPTKAHRKSTGALRVRRRCDCATSATSPEVVATGNAGSSTLEHVWQSFATSCDSTPGGPREGERRRRVEVLQRSLLDVARDARDEVVLLAAEGQPLRPQVLLEHRRAQLRQPPRCLHLRPLCGTRRHRRLEPLRRPLAAAAAAAHGLRHAERGDEAADGLHAARLAEPGGVWDGSVLEADVKPRCCSKVRLRGGVWHGSDEVSAALGEGEVLHEPARGFELRRAERARLESGRQLRLAHGVGEGEVDEVEAARVSSPPGLSGPARASAAAARPAAPRPAAGSAPAASRKARGRWRA
mmetsp:Transcript_27393/g.82782  ORF Transcript_27393/g.82782 Transcript_27393/m.82782 type:complete len:302 (-) Transcript_27393:1553-2458(-)